MDRTARICGREGCGTSYWVHSQTPPEKYPRFMYCSSYCFTHDLKVSIDTGLRKAIDGMASNVQIVDDLPFPARDGGVEQICAGCGRTACRYENFDGHDVWYCPVHRSERIYERIIGRFRRQLQDRGIE